MGISNAAALEPFVERGRGPLATELSPMTKDARRITVPVIEEALQVDKKTVDKGAYRITKQVSTRQETVDELLRDHTVLIERRPIGATLQGSEIPQQRYEGDVLVIPVVEEILVTEKRLVLIEEVRITRVQGTHRETQQVTLRKEQISIERREGDDQSHSEPSPPAEPDRARHQRPLSGQSRSRR